MPQIIRLPGAALSCVLLVGCAGPGGQRVSPEEYARIERQAQASSVLSQASESRDERARDDGLEQRGRDLAERLADARFEANELVHRRERVALEQASDEAQRAVDRSRALLELEHAREALVHFDQDLAPLRREQDALELTRTRDALLDQREELAQLELMYAGAELGEGTAEIVMERARRAIVRAEAALELRQRRSQELLQVELPREREELLSDVARKEVAAANAEREVQLGTLARAAALRQLEHDAQGSERRLAALAREQLELESDRRASERERIGEAFDGGGTR